MTDGNGGGSGKTPVVNRPFITGSRFASDHKYDNSTVLTGSTIKLPTYELETDGYSAGLYILAELSGVGNATATATFLEDTPFSVYDTIEFKDTNNKSILGPMSGHDLYIATKYGGYHFNDDAKNSPVFSMTSGTGATQGSFTFVLYMPIEIVHRDALGALTNKSSSSVFSVALTVAATTSIYSGTTGDPATSATLRTRIGQYGWMDSDLRDVKGNSTSPEPPGVNTIQYWDKQNFSFDSGAMIKDLSQFSGGLRNMIIELRDSDGTRSGNEGDFPDPFTVTVDKTTLHNQLRTIMRHLIGEDYGYTTLEVANGSVGTPAGEGLHRDYGTYPFPFTKDYGLKPGGENRFGYLWLTSATKVTLRGTVGSGSASHQFNVLLNYVNPAAGDPKAMTGGR